MVLLLLLLDSLAMPAAVAHCSARLASLRACPKDCAERL